MIAVWVKVALGCVRKLQGELRPEGLKFVQYLLVDTLSGRY